MIEILEEKLGAGELKTFMYQGAYIEILDAQYPVDVFLMDRSGGQISTMRKAEASFFSRPGQFEVVQMQSANAQTVRFFVGSGDAGTRRTSGVVQVVDGEKSRTIAGGMFAGSPFIAADPANLSQVQLWNPAGSGKRLIVGRVSVQSPSALTVNAYTAAAALANDMTVARAANKLAGAAMGAGQVRSGLVGAMPVFNNQLVKTLFALANTTAQWDVRGAVVLQPGTGLNVIHSAPNVQVGADFEWFEEAI